MPRHSLVSALLLISLLPALAQQGQSQPGGLAATRATVPAATPAGGATLTYLVQTGDTLYRVATGRGLTVEALMALNGLKTPDISVGQTLRLPSGSATTPVAGPTPAPSKPAPPKPTPTKSAPASQPPPTPAPIDPVPAIPSVPPGGSGEVGGVSVRAPARLRMGDAFVLRLSGGRAGQAQVSFASEVGEDVRRPAEVLTPTGAAGEYVVLGRVVLGKTTPLVYTVTVGTEVLRRSVPVTGLEQPIQHLKLPKEITDRLTARNRPAEEGIVEAAYRLRTQQAWSRPFAPPLASTSVSSSFGQPRTYLAGGEVKYHYGMDFLAPAGTKVRAVNDGIVVIAGSYPVRGGLVGIDHGAGLVSLYFHQREVKVKVGQRVARGDVIGEVGTTGVSTAPHLHLEMRVRGEATLPTLYFGKLWP